MHYSDIIVCHAYPTSVFVQLEKKRKEKKNKKVAATTVGMIAASISAETTVIPSIRTKYVLDL